MKSLEGFALQVNPFQSSYSLGSNCLYYTNNADPTSKLVNLLYTSISFNSLTLCNSVLPSSFFFDPFKTLFRRLFLFGLV